MTIEEAKTLSQLLIEKLYELCINIVAWVQLPLPSAVDRLASLIPGLLGNWVRLMTNFVLGWADNIAVYEILLFLLPLTIMIGGIRQVINWLIT